LLGQSGRGALPSLWALFLVRDEAFALPCTSRLDNSSCQTTTPYPPRVGYGKTTITPTNASRTRTWLLLLPAWLCIFFFSKDKLRRSCSFSAGTPLPLPPPCAGSPPRSRSPSPCVLSPPLYIVVAVVKAPVDGLGIICSSSNSSSGR